MSAIRLLMKLGTISQSALEERALAPLLVRRGQEKASDSMGSAGLCWQSLALEVH